MKRIILIVLGILAAAGVTYAVTRPKKTEDKDKTANSKAPNTKLTGKTIGKDTEISYIDSNGLLVVITNPTQSQVQTAMNNNIDNSITFLDPTFGFQFGIFG